MKLLSKNTEISKSGAKFIILDVTEKFYLAEQLIENKVVAYEVGKTIASKKLIDFDKRIYSDELFQDIPTTNAFGKNEIDKTFNRKSKNKALEYFINVVNNNGNISRKPFGDFTNLLKKV